MAKKLYLKKNKKLTMKTKLLLTLIIISCRLYSQNIIKSNIEFILSPAFEKITIKNFSEKNCRVKIFNEKGLRIKTISLPEGSRNQDIVIQIENIEIGKYSFVICKDNKQLFRNEFIKDWFDSDLLY